MECMSGAGEAFVFPSWLKRQRADCGGQGGPPKTGCAQLRPLEDGVESAAWKGVP